MSSKFHVTRRDFLRYASAGAVGLLVGLPLELYAKASTTSGFRPDVWLELTAAPHSIALRPGPQTNVWAYRTRLLRGDPASVQAMPGSYLGPILRLPRGQKLRVDFVNRLDEPSIVNWHGLHVPSRMMGEHQYEVAPGGRCRYEFTVDNRAGTYWYHAFPAVHTPEQVYFGLAGLVYVSDHQEQALPLPRGEYDLPIVIQDRTWGHDNQFQYPLGTGPNASQGGISSQSPTMGGGMMGGGMMRHGMMSGHMGDMMTRVMGFYGDDILVNGRPNATLEVATHAYRLRVLNASNSRIYKLAWQDGRPLTVIATGGGLLEQPAHKDYVMLAPGQRVELWADFGKDAVGTELTMMSLAFQGSMGRVGNMMGRMMGRAIDGLSLAAGAQFPIFKIRVTRKVTEVLELPEHLSTIHWLHAKDAVNHAHPRAFRTTMERMRWGLNGRSFQMHAVAPDEVVKLNTTEIWEFENSMMMAHAMHLHGLQFQVLERLNSPAGDGVDAGYLPQGWKDTVLVMPNERVKLLMRFKDYTGMYQYQCHMLEHAADGLMRNYVVEA